MSAQEKINQKFIELLESGVAPWRMPWKSRSIGLATNIVSGKMYTGCNFFMTNFHEFNSSKWGTFNQFQKLGGQVRKGEKGTPIIFYSSFEKEISEDNKKSIPFCKLSYVFNIDQVDGITINESNQVEIKEHDPIASCEKVIENFPLGFPKAEHKQDKAFYRPSSDTINMPELGLFSSAEEYYHTYFHESIHATGHERRLGREGVKPDNYFGDSVYSKEELIAELGASYMSAHCGIDNHVIDNSASYIAGWLKVLKENPRYITSCSSQAWKAYQYLINEPA
jgi:antirestriction protein ArdC